MFLLALLLITLANAQYFVKSYTLGTPSLVAGGRIYISGYSNAYKYNEGYTYTAQPLLNAAPDFNTGSKGNGRGGSLAGTKVGYYVWSARKTPHSPF